MSDALTLDQAAHRQPRPHDVLAALTRDRNAGVCVVDGAGALLFMNPAAERLLGWPEAALAGRPIHDVIHVPHVEADCSLLDALRSGRDVTVDADMFTRRDGAVLPVSFTSSPILADGQVTGAVVTFRNRAARKRAEEQLREREEAYEVLEQRVAERTRELSALLEVSHNVASTLELAPLL